MRAMLSPRLITLIAWGMFFSSGVSNGLFFYALLRHPDETSKWLRAFYSLLWR